MIAVETAADRHALVTPNFRIRFDWVEDRWIHALDLSIGGSWRMVAATVESSREPTEAERVVSPAYQDVRLEGGADEMRALLLGQSGPHHFSAVVAMKETDHSVLLDVDVADRCRGSIFALAATYRIDLAASELESAGSEGVIWRPEGSNGVLVFGQAGQHNHPTRIALAESGRRSALVQAASVLDPDLTTHRLYYSWRWATDSTRD
jgi:hypothetical protein